MTALATSRTAFYGLLHLKRFFRLLTGTTEPHLPIFTCVIYVRFPGTDPSSRLGPNYSWSLTFEAFRIVLIVCLQTLASWGCIQVEALYCVFYFALDEASSLLDFSLTQVSDLDNGISGHFGSNFVKNVYFTWVLKQ